MELTLEKLNELKIRLETRIKLDQGAVKRINQTIQDVLKDAKEIYTNGEPGIDKLDTININSILTPDLSVLSNKEKEVFGWVKKGLKNKEISSHLKLSGRTVESHKRSIRHKLGLKSAKELKEFSARLR